MTETTRLLIVAPAFDRPASLGRLLDSLARMILPEGLVADLVVSIDKGGDPGNYQIAEKFEWTLGSKQVIQREQHLGLRRHIIELGSMLADQPEYDAVMMVEDDLLVSPAALQFANRALHCYQHQDGIAGISLYCYQRNEYNQLPFEPLDDGHDSYFMQLPSSWGQLWSRSQWLDFQGWYEDNQERVASIADGLPAAVVAWSGANSWKKFFALYLLESGRYIVYPRSSYSTNFSEPGTNQIRDQNKYQVPLAGKFQPPRLCQLEQSGSVYDMHFEPDNARCKLYCDQQIPAHQVEFDLYLEKIEFRPGTTHVIGRSPGNRGLVIRSWDDRLTPAVNNVTYGIDGEKIFLYPVLAHRPPRKLDRFVNENPVLFRASYRTLVATLILKLLGRRGDH